MKISGSAEPLRPDRISPAGGETRPQPARTEPVTETERVRVSDLAARLSQLEAQFGQSDFDAKKVEEVRAAIADGRFRVNADAVADKLLSSVAELLGRKA